MPVKTFIVTDASATEIPGTLVYQGFSRNAIFTPASNLPASEVISVKLTTGVKNTDGVALAADFDFSFTTAAAAAPTVIATGPSNGATNVPRTDPIAVQFDEDIDPTTLVG